VKGYHAVGIAREGSARVGYATHMVPHCGDGLAQIKLTAVGLHLRVLREGEDDVAEGLIGHLMRRHTHELAPSQILGIALLALSKEPSNLG